MSESVSLPFNWGLIAHRFATYMHIITKLKSVILQTALLIKTVRAQKNEHIISV